MSNEHDKCCFGFALNFNVASVSVSVSVDVDVDVNSVSVSSRSMSLQSRPQCRFGFSLNRFRVQNQNMTSIEDIECVEQNTCADEDDVEQRMYLSQINNCIAEFDVLTEYYAAAADFQTANHK
eukprot:scaffold37052_cov46-Cyclotella_meneghiniana.AAC.3